MTRRKLQVSFGEFIQPAPFIGTQGQLLFSDSIYQHFGAATIIPGYGKLIEIYRTVPLNAELLFNAQFVLIKLPYVVYTFHYAYILFVYFSN